MGKIVLAWRKKSAGSVIAHLKVASHWHFNFRLTPLHHYKQAQSITKLQDQYLSILQANLSLSAFIPSCRAETLVCHSFNHDSHPHSGGKDP